MAGEPITPSAYHDATKHHFHGYARSLGYLDWATQPDPFRRFDGAPIIELPRPSRSPTAPYDALFGAPVAAAPIALDTIGAFLRLSLGLSAWKQYGASRWALRVNPSSGNLHPTEAYIAWNGGIYHYAPALHAIERRADSITPGNGLIVALTSIHWREAWKYGERAFRYCQHDIGHAIAALRFAAALHGWSLQLLPWDHRAIATLVGTDRDDDFAEAEREEPECAAWVGAPGVAAPDPSCVRASLWYGRANRLSSSRVEWPLIDQVAAATRRESPSAQHQAPTPQSPAPNRHSSPSAPRSRGPLDRQLPGPSDLLAADVILRRRSALGYDPRGHLRRAAFARMLDRLQPGAPPWDAVDWPPHLHLALFVHRVQEIPPGIYACVRGADDDEALKRAMRQEFLWEPVAGIDRLFLLAPIDVRATANRLSCNQDIAEDGFFSLGMLARFEQPLRDRPWFYRRLFWEAGMIGQVLYLEAEAAGARGTGIGCFFDDPVHDLLGLSGHEWQSLYHFSAGLPVEDGRLTTESGYPWDQDRS